MRLPRRTGFGKERLLCMTTELRLNGGDTRVCGSGNRYEGVWKKSKGRKENEIEMMIAIRSSGALATQVTQIRSLTRFVG
jgi:hypothetical protein